MKMTLYDSLYLALTIVKRAVLVTADKKLAKLSRAVLPGDIVTIG